MQKIIQKLRPLICPFEPLLAHLRPGSHVLDVGCGTGSLLLQATQKGLVREALGIDVSEAALAQARQAWAQLRPADGSANLVFEKRMSAAELEGTWATVMMIDVIHHVPPSEQQAFVRAAMHRVQVGGRFIYKDMCRRPFWKAGMNRLHDLVMARQWIHYVPMEHVLGWAQEEGLTCVHRANYSRVWYGHELTVFERVA